MNLGIPFTKIGDIFEIEAKYLMPNSRSLVKYICDYCGEKCITSYSVYKKSAQRGKLSCGKCKHMKIKDTFFAKYGNSNFWEIPENKNKAKETMLKKYGTLYFIQTPEGKEKFKKSMKEKYGYENPSYCPELQAKAKKSMYKNNTVPSSLPEKKIIEILIELYGEESCKPGYPVDRVNLDCLLLVDGYKIDVEYDGLYWHKNTKDYDRKRNHWLISQGYKVLRILGNIKDEIPSKERIKEEIDYILNGHDIGYIDMNN